MYPYVEDFSTSDLTNRIQLTQGSPTLKTSCSEIYAALYRHGVDSTINVAIKRLLYLGHPDAVAKNSYALRKEVIALMSVRHPNVVPFMGTYSMATDVCIVTMWADNGSLSRFLQENPGADRQDLLSQIASGLEYLHRPIHTTRNCVVIHGDLHIDNVVVSASGRPMICDFGLCKVVPEDHAASLSVRIEKIAGGRVAYLAPELHLDGVRRSSSTDVFSFGVLSWHVYSGRVPFSSCNTATILLKMAKGERPVRGELTRDDIPGYLWTLICACWAADSNSRPTMAVVRNRLSISQ